MISKIKEILNTKVVLINEEQKGIIFDNLIKILKNNIFIFFILGTIVSIIEWNHINWYNNYYLEDSSGRIDFIYSVITFMLFYYYIPFYLYIILNLIIKFSKNEKVKKVFIIIMIITHVLSVIYLLLFVLMIYAVAHMFDNNSVSFFLNFYNIKCI